MLLGGAACQWHVWCGNEDGYQKAVVLHTAEYAAMRLCRFHGVVGGSSVIKPISPGHPAQTYK